MGIFLGGVKGGVDFDLKYKSDVELLRFCRFYMMELYKFLGFNMDILVGDLGVF